MFSPEKIVYFRSIPTPFYYYDLELLRNTLSIVKEEANKYGYHVHYALKANSNVKILETIQSFGLGADCVSGNEIKRAITCNFLADKIAFAGVGKSDEEINIGLTIRDIPEDIIISKEIVQLPFHGEASFVQGEMSYKSEEGFLGKDSLSYRIFNVDNALLADTAAEVRARGSRAKA